LAVDLGSNIGISALYFLTRNRTSRCHLYEPVPENVAKLRQNLAGYEERYTLHEQAVSDHSGRARFGVEATGRYGGIGVDTGAELEVEVVHVDDVLRRALAEADAVDILKIDTEGAEIPTIAAIAPELAERVDVIVAEAAPTEPLRPEIFDAVQLGSVCRLTRRDRGRPAP
jgi:FkbM family methyltransferase